MANIKISELPQVSSLLNTDVLPAVASSITSKITVQNLSNSLTQVSSSISSSYAISASYATTASYALNAVSIDTSSFITTGSIGSTQGITGSLLINGSTNISNNIIVTGSIVSNTSLRIKDTSNDGGDFFVSPSSDYLYFASDQDFQPEFVLALSGSSYFSPRPNHTRLVSSKGFSIAVNQGMPIQMTGSLNVTGSFTHRDGYTILTKVSSSLNFLDDTAAASGGVPLGGLYRNGNAIQIRLV
jgi:hypothetical protein